MRTVNLAMIVGRVGRDPELRTGKSGVPWLQLSVATNRGRKDGDTWTDVTDWHDVRVLGREAETCARIVGKGALVSVQGALTYDTWTGGDGARHTKARIVADRVTLLSSPAERPAATDTPAADGPPIVAGPAPFELPVG